MPKLPGIYQDQYALGYWAGYADAEVEWITCGDLELSTEDSPKPTHNTEIVSRATQGKFGASKDQQGRGLPKLRRWLTWSLSSLYCKSSQLM